MKKMIRRIIPEEDVPDYFNKLHNISGKVANKFYNDMETPVQIILGPIGSGKLFLFSFFNTNNSLSSTGNHPIDNHIFREHIKCFSCVFTSFYEKNDTKNYS
jgi:hypothetical protein